MVVVYYRTTASITHCYGHHIWSCCNRLCAYYYSSCSRIASRYTRYFDTYLITYSISTRFCTRWYRNRTIAVKRWRCRACYTCCWGNYRHTYSSCCSCLCSYLVVIKYTIYSRACYRSVTKCYRFIISLYIY